MFEISPEPQRDLRRAVSDSAEAHQDITDLRRDLKTLAVETDGLRAFNYKLVALLRDQLNLDLTVLELSQRQSENRDTRRALEAEHHTAPLCASCGRPLQDEKSHCVYCGRDVASATNAASAQDPGHPMPPTAPPPLP